MSKQTYCYHCMNVIESDPCPHCGFSNASYLHEDFLPPKTVLQGRYVIGRVFEHDNAGVNYYAFDASDKCRVEIREFFPGELCERDEDDKNVYVTQGNIIRYKVLKSDFVELFGMRKKVNDCDSFPKVLHVFEENNTVYLVSQVVEGTLLRRLCKPRGRLADWAQVKVAFLPLLQDLQMMHETGLVHRGISLDTLVVEGTKVWLKGFCVGSLRVTMSEITPCLYEGYTPPEQYSATTSNGPFSDVYSICAVIYTVLCGLRPVVTPEMSGEDLANTLLELNPTVPVNVAHALGSGLVHHCGKRMQSMDLLIRRLNQPGYRCVREQMPPQVNPTDKKQHKVNSIWKIAGYTAVGLTVLVLILLLVLFLPKWVVPTGSEVVSSNTSSNITSDIVSSDIVAPSSVATGTMVIMPNLVGQTITDVVENESYREMVTLSVVYAYHDSVASGFIMAQNIQPDEKVAEGTQVEVVVSKGNQYPVVPSFDGLTLTEYTMRLESLGLTVQAVADDSYNVANQLVVAVSPKVGTRIDLEVQNIVTVRYGDKSSTAPPIPYE